jgi:thiol-disulfide isomerase/thioredoxin
MRRAPFDSTRRNLLAALAAGPGLLVPVRAQSPLGIGSKLALADLPLIEGGTFRAADAQGKVVVLYGWASWCPFCAEMSPSIEQLWRTQRDKGLTVLGVSIDKTIEPAREYRRRKGYTFPSAWSPGDGAGVLPRIAKVPMLWVRNRAGRIVMAESGQLFPEDVEQIARFL